jgi:hypothetical protein
MLNMLTASTESLQHPPSTCAGMPAQRTPNKQQQAIMAVAAARLKATTANCSSIKHTHSLAATAACCIPNALHAACCSDDLGLPVQPFHQLRHTAQHHTCLALCGLLNLAATAAAAAAAADTRSQRCVSGLTSAAAAAGGPSSRMAAHTAQARFLLYLAA